MSAVRAFTVGIWENEIWLMTPVVDQNYIKAMAKRFLKMMKKSPLFVFFAFFTEQAICIITTNRKLECKLKLVSESLPR